MKTEGRNKGENMKNGKERNKGEKAQVRLNKNKCISAYFE